MDTCDGYSAHLSGPISPWSHPNGCATALSHRPRTVKTTISPRASAEALSCRRSRCRSSFATTWTRTAVSDSVCEHRDSGTSGARLIPTFVRRGRGQQAKRAGGKEAEGGAHHRAQHGRIGGCAPAHLAARQAVLVHAAADAVCCASSLSTAMEITMNAVSCTVSDVSTGLPKSRYEQRRTQHTLSAVVEAARLIRLG